MPPRRSAVLTVFRGATAINDRAGAQDGYSCKEGQKVVSRKCFAGRRGVGLSPQNHPLKSDKNRGNKIGFYLCKKGQG